MVGGGGWEGEGGGPRQGADKGPTLSVQEKLCFVAFADFRGVNTPADLRLPTSSH